MLYHVLRNGQMYGPYTLEDLRRYVAAGNVLPTDMAKNDAMPEWMTVQQILGDLGTPGAPGYPPVAQAGSYVMMNTETYPDPPNLPWGLVLLFNVLSCGLFIIVWNILIAAWMKRVQPASVALFYYIAVAAVSLSSGGVFFALRHHHVLQHHPYAGLLGIVGWVIKLVARFTLKADLERHYNGAEPLGLQLNSVLTFFFGGLYFQSQLNRIVEVKNAIRFRGAR